MKYSAERREAILKKMMPPENRTIPEIAKEEGVPTATLYSWRNKARNEGRLMPDGDVSPSGWSSRDKFTAVLETASLNEAELAEYCRSRGLYPEQIKEWRGACEQANDWQASQEKKLKEELKGHRRKQAKLETELARKDKALAEAAALLILKKKVQNLWGDLEDE